MLTQILTWIGLATTLTLLYRLARFIQLYTQPSEIHRYLRPNAYALITGATDGIGKAFAHELASRGMNVILHGRNPEKMEGVRSSLASSYPDRDFRTLIADASDSHGMKRNIAAMASSLQDLPGPLTIMINNCGGGPSHDDPYTLLRDMSPTDIDFTINLNARFCSHLTRAILPKLIQDGPSLLLNLGSMAALEGIPYMSMYAGTKAFDLVWSKSLTHEFAASKIDTECIGLLVGVVSATQGLKGPGTFFGPSAVNYVKKVFDRVGCGRAVIYPYWPHAFQGAILSSMSEPLQNYFILFNLRKAMGSDPLSKKSS